MARGKGACGGQRRKDGSGGGRGNRGTKRQPKRTLTRFKSILIIIGITMICSTAWSVDYKLEKITSSKMGDDSYKLSQYAETEDFDGNIVNIKISEDRISRTDVQKIIDNCDAQKKQALEIIEEMEKL